MSSSVSQFERTSHQDDTSHGYIHVVEADEHDNKLTLELLEACSKNFSAPVVFRKMVPLDKRVGSREFLEIEADQKLAWREKKDDKPVTFRNEDGGTDYNYVTGEEGTAREFLDAIFVDNKDVYAHLGRVSSGYAGLYALPWGTTFFDHVRAEVMRSGWFQIPPWELSGHVFLGNNTQSYAEPSSGAPGSDWHMFPTTNIFVMIAGRKKWMTRPPQPGDHLRNREELVFPTGGREGPVEDRRFDTVYLESGDVLFNVPFEWHKVLNAQGPSLGAAFRVIDTPYRDELASLPQIVKNLKLKELPDEYAHLATSLKMASCDLVRMQMALNAAEMMICTAARFDFGR